ncbi:MAG: NAD-dependent deacylase [Phycisphaerales bacterium]
MMRRMDHNTNESAELAIAIADAAQRLAASTHVTILTGAGASAESDIPTFRDSMKGLWASFDPQSLATPEAFAADPGLVTKWYDQRRLGCLAADPNAGHWALAEMESQLRSRGRSFTLLTQNVDGLHQRAGSRAVVELHGSILRWRCTRTGRPVDPGADPIDPAPHPSPHADNAWIRPDVVWFGESLPTDAVVRAQTATQQADCFLSIGTSSVVYPAAGFIAEAARAGATVIEVNPDATELSHHADVALRGTAATALPRLVATAFPTDTAADDESTSGG